MRRRGHVIRGRYGWQVWLWIASIGGYKCLNSYHATREDARLVLKAWR